MQFKMIKAVTHNLAHEVSKKLLASVFYFGLLITTASCAEEQKLEASASQATKEKVSASSIEASPKTLSTAQNQKTDTQNNTIDLLKSGDIFVLDNSDSELVASYFSTLPSNSETQFKHIVWLLNRIRAETSFIALVEQRLPNNRRLKKDNFVLTLTDIDSSQHKFEYISNAEQRLYTLNYYHTKNR